MKTDESVPPSLGSLSGLTEDCLCDGDTTIQTRAQNRLNKARGKRSVAATTQANTEKYESNSKTLLSFAFGFSFFGRQKNKCQSVLSCVMGAVLLTNNTHRGEFFFKWT